MKMPSTPENVFGYPDAIWQRFVMPAHAGTVSGAAKVVEVGSPAARLLLRISVMVERGYVSEARFLAHGCPVTIAVGEWLAAQLMGQKLAGVGINAADICQALEIPDDKTHCALMGEDIIRRLQEQVAT